MAFDYVNYWLRNRRVEPRFQDPSAEDRHRGNREWLVEAEEW